MISVCYKMMAKNWCPLASVGHFLQESTPGLAGPNPQPQFFTTDKLWVPLKEIQSIQKPPFENMIVTFYNKFLGWRTQFYK